MDDHAGLHDDQPALLMCLLCRQLGIANLILVPLNAILNAWTGKLSDDSPLGSSTRSTTRQHLHASDLGHRYTGTLFRPPASDPQALHEDFATLPQDFSTLHAAQLVRS